MRVSEHELRQKYELMSAGLNESGRRRWAAIEARMLGRGGVSAVARATGLSRTTIHAGLRSLQDKKRAKLEKAGRSRKAGAGRKRLTQLDSGLSRALNELVDPGTRGDPMSPLRWTSKSTAKLAVELSARGHFVSARTVAALLTAEGFSMQAMRKTHEGTDHPHGDEQFKHLNGRVKT